MGRWGKRETPDPVALRKPESRSSSLRCEVGLHLLAGLQRQPSKQGQRAVGEVGMQLVHELDQAVLVVGARPMPKTSSAQVPSAR